VYVRFFRGTAGTLIFRTFSGLNPDLAAAALDRIYFYGKPLCSRKKTRLLSRFFVEL